MKKIFIGLLIACTLFTTTAYASSIDLESMTTDELIELRSQVIKELDNRVNFDENKIYIGSYVVGKDIKAGNYIIVFEKNDNIELDEEGGKVVLYKNQEDADQWDSFFDRYYYFGQECYIELKDGMVMSIVYSSGTIRPVLKPSWAP